MTGQWGGAIARLAPPGFYTVKEAARLVGCSPDRLTRLRKKQKYVPHFSMMCGTVNVPLYHESDIQYLKYWFPGPAPVDPKTGLALL
jgi:hypothetical protein